MGVDEKRQGRSCEKWGVGFYALHEEGSADLCAGGEMSVNERASRRHKGGGIRVIIHRPKHQVGSVEHAVCWC